MVKNTASTADLTPSPLNIADSDYYMQHIYPRKVDSGMLATATSAQSGGGENITRESPWTSMPQAGRVDYEIQLRLLEQQNKRRLEMARSNADSRSNAQSSSQATPNQPIASTPSMSTFHAGQLMGPHASYTAQAPQWADYVPTRPANEALQAYQMELMLAEQAKKLRAQNAADLEKAADVTMPHRFPVAAQMTGPTTHQYDRSGLQTNSASDLAMDGPTLESFDFDKFLKAEDMRESSSSTALPVHHRYTSAPAEEVKVDGHDGACSESWPDQPRIMRYQRVDGTQIERTLPMEDGSPALSNLPDAKVEGSHKKTTKGKRASKGRHKVPKVSEMIINDSITILPVRATHAAASVFCKPFCDFMTNNPTVFHAVETQRQQLLDAGWTELDERDKWDIVPGGTYFTVRNGSAMIAFTVGEKYEPGNGCAIIAGHVDALTAKLKPVSEVPNKAGYLQLGVAPYAGGMNSTWWDRDLGIGGRVLVREDDKIVTKLVKLDWPIARIPTLAPHFGAVANGPFNQETQMVPIIGLEGTDTSATDTQVTKPFSRPSLLGGEGGPVGNFVNTQPPALVKVIGNALGLTASTYASMVGWELELFDTQPATTGGLNKEFIFAGRLDDKLCSWSAMQALISSQERGESQDSSIIKMVGWFDNEEIGSQLRQGAKSNYLPLTIERAVGSLAKGKGKKPGPNLFGRTYANSFLVSSDVTHAVNPNFLNAYMENHAPHLNVGLSVHADPNGHMTTDAISTAILQRCADSVGAKLQVFQIRNDSRSGGTVGPMLSSLTGIRAIDAGVAQLSMHSIRATTGALDPGLAVITYMGFLNRFEFVDREFRK